MTISEAKNKLEINSNDPEEIRDRYEEKVFQQVQLFLKDPVIPSLFQSRMEKIAELEKALLFLVPEKETRDFTPIHRIDLSSTRRWRELWLSYEKNKAIIRTALSGVYVSSSLQSLVNSLIENEKSYGELLTRFTNRIPANHAIKISEPVSITLLLNECDLLQGKGLIDDSLESLQKITDNLLTFNLSKEVNRLRKIVTNG